MVHAFISLSETDGGQEHSSTINMHPYTFQQGVNARTQEVGDTLFILFKIHMGKLQIFYL